MSATGIECLPIWLVEPDPGPRRVLVAQDLAEPVYSGARQSTPLDLNEIRRRLRTVREFARDNLDRLTERLERDIARNHPTVSLFSARNQLEAVNYISSVAEGLCHLAINNSDVVSRELRPGLMARGFTVVNSYPGGAQRADGGNAARSDKPRLIDNNLVGSFSVSRKLAGLDLVDGEPVLEYVAVLGVNAAGAEDCTLLLLQHFSNVYDDLRRARKVVLVVGLDKIVKNKEDALFQTVCMGIFGLEGVLSALASHLPPHAPTPATLPRSDDAGKDLHVIILDNGRSDLLRGKHKDILLCIGCRACRTCCPLMGSVVDEADVMWTPRNYSLESIQGDRSFENICLHCEACRVECPLGIDLPGMIWEAQIERVGKYGAPVSQRLLAAPELIGSFGTRTAPFANWLMTHRLPRLALEYFIGIDRRANLPAFQRRTLREMLNSREKR